jgi:hypothetical protein
MKQLIVCLCLLLTGMDCRSDQHGTGDENIAAAKSAIQALAGALQTELKHAIGNGGPVSAIEICNTRAMPITQQVASENGLHLARVSLKNRNPVNQANEWQTVVLEDFERQKAGGKSVDSLVWSETVENDGVKEFRFMRAIPTGEVCLLCHGTAISPEVGQVLAGLYPSDRATGFRIGDIRGAFVVTRLSAGQGGGNER